MTSHEPHGPGTVTVPAGQVGILLAALGEAAESRRDQAAMCADCADQSCATCQWRLEAADAYDQVAAEIIQAAETSATQPVSSHAAPASGGQPPTGRPDSDPAPDSPGPADRQSGAIGDAMKRRKDSQPSPAPGTRPPEYVIVVAAADWVKERYPENRFNLWDALNAGKDPDPEPCPKPEADLEAEP